MRYRIVYVLLVLLKDLTRAFYSLEVQWVGKVPEDPWPDYRLVALLNHTSLFEVLFAGLVPNKFLWRLARHGIVPIASKTINRPLSGKLWRLVAGNVVSVSRERDETWKKVMDSVDPRSMPVILPEGRMKRLDGRDSFGRPLTVRSGIADLIEAAAEGKMLLAYSQGLHHVHIPDHHFFPRLFQPVRIRLEAVDVGEYRQALLERAGGTGKPFTTAVIADITARRDRYCTSDVGARDEIDLAQVPE
jgi:hypothetical protein